MMAVQPPRLMSRITQCVMHFGRSFRILRRVQVGYACDLNALMGYSRPLLIFDDERDEGRSPNLGKSARLIGDQCRFQSYAMLFR